MDSTSRRSVRSVVADLSLEIRVLLAFGAVLAVLVFANSWGIFTPDTKPEIFMQPGETARRYAQSWIDSPGLGAPNYNTGVAPLAGLFAVFEWAGIPAWVIMRLWRLSLLLLAAWGARLAVRELVGRSLTGNALAVAGVVSAVVYAANPYTVVGGGTTPTLQPYALLPWLVVCWLRGLRAPSLRWVVAAALVLAAMGGLNAGVVPLIQLVVIIPLVVHAMAVERIRFRAIALVILGSGLVYALLSAYWLVPALQAMGAGTAVAEGTESAAAINAANSYAEVLRGLGMWTLYGGDGSGPFNPGHLPYVTSPVVVLLTFGIPILAAVGTRLSVSPARLFGAVSILVGALLMVGLYPMSDRSTWSRALEWAFDTVPGLIAFRTTNKVGAVLLLGLAILVALAAAELFTRLQETWQRVTAVLTGLAIAAAGIAPALTGGLFPVQMDIPDYWLEAGEVVDSRGGDSRVLMVPGAGAPHYEWGYRSPDEIGPAVFARPFVFRTVYASGDPHGAAMLAEVDRRLRLGTLPEGTMSALARYLGAGDVVSRYGLASDDVDAERIEAQLGSDPGLTDPDIFPDTAADGQILAAARRVSNQGEGPPLRLVPARGALIVDGSGAALPSLVSTGLSAGDPALLLSPALSDEQLGRAMADGGRLVVTDSNLRRAASNTQATGFGPVLPADEEPEVTRALFDAAAQSTAVFHGNATAEHRGENWSFGLFGYGGIEQAFDGDPSTSWRFGHFKTGVGHAAVITPDEPIVMERILLTPDQRSSSRITEARVTAELSDRSVEVEVTIPEWRTIPTAVDLPNEPVTRLEIEVTGVDGSGNTPVGFTEISIPGIEIERFIHLSDDLALRARRVADATGVDLAAVPIDIVMERSVGDQDGGTAEEGVLLREFTVVDGRSFEARGMVRLADGVEDWRIDLLNGAGGPVRAHSSSRFDGLPEHRASKAIDGTTYVPDLDTGWSPGDPVIGEWISIDFPRQRLDSVAITQGTDDGVVSEVLISIDDGEPFGAELQPGRTVVELPQPSDASRVRILITEWNGTGRVMIRDVGLPRIRPSSAPPECQTIAWIDNRPLRARVGMSMERLLEGAAVPFELCNGTLELEEGPHLITGASGFALDLLHLADSTATASTVRTSELHLVGDRTTSLTATVGSDCSPCWLALGQSPDSRWAATVNGQPLGSPVVIDGYGAGWRIDAAEGATITVTFQPQRLTIIAWVITGVSLLLSTAVILLATFRPLSFATSPTLRKLGPKWQRFTPVKAAGLHRRSRTLGRGPLREAGPIMAALTCVPMIWWTVGPAVAGLALAALVWHWAVQPASRTIGSAAVLAMILVPVAWSAGSVLPLWPAIARGQDNLIAHHVGGLALWLLFLAVVFDQGRHRSEEQR